MNQMGDGVSNATTMETLQNSLGHMKMLRCSMNNVFESITNHLDNTAVAATSTSTEVPTLLPEDRDRNFKLELNSNMQRVIANVRELEKLIMSLNAPASGFMLGNTTQINQEVSGDKIPLYSQLIDSYKWLEKVHEYSGLAIPLLGQNPLKRTYFGVSLNAKRRKVLATSTFNIQNTAIIDNAIMSIKSNFGKDTDFKLLRPMGSNTILCITLGRTLRAIIILKGWLIEWVMIRGVNEEISTESGEIDLWTESKYKIFQKVTDNANAAMLHFHVPIHPELSVRSYITWFHSYVNLFSQPCKKCGLHLVNNMPPTWRDLRSLEPFHEECKP